jgi:hypothetical protein
MFGTGKRDAAGQALPQALSRRAMQLSRHVPQHERSKILTPVFLGGLVNNNYETDKVDCVNCKAAGGITACSTNPVPNCWLIDVFMRPLTAGRVE